jgi:hypothetical protein
MLGLLHQDLGRGLTIVEEGVDLINLVLGDLELTEGAGKHHSGGDELHHISEGGLSSDGSEMGKGVLLDFDVLSSTSDG